MIDFMKDLVDRNPKIKPFAEPLYSAPSYSLFLAILDTNDDFEKAITLAKEEKEEELLTEIKKIIDKLLLENNLLRDDFETEDIEKVEKYIKLWVHVV
jgi:molecular chaperone GrpE (heat shock protein)